MGARAPDALAPAPAPEVDADSSQAYFPMNRFMNNSLSRIYQIQAKRLAPMRARILRRAGIGRKRRVLDLGCGTGAVTPELARRSGGMVAALDEDINALRSVPENFRSSHRIRGDARNPPFAEKTFDLVFSQLFFLWTNAENAAREIFRVLQPEGILIAFEPDYGGMMEHPEEGGLKDVWNAALRRAGADPIIGRKLPEILEKCGFKTRIDLLPEISGDYPEKWDIMATLPLNESEKKRAAERKNLEKESGKVFRPLVHLPFFIITAQKKLR